MKLGVKSFVPQSAQTCCMDKTSNNDFKLCQNCINSCYFSPQAGVFQGESLSPFLFTMYLNDINNYMKIDPDVGMSFYQFLLYYFFLLMTWYYSVTVEMVYRKVLIDYTVIVLIGDCKLIQTKQNVWSSIMEEKQVY